jgi:hypothetical protein
MSEVTSVREWKAKSDPFPLELPSGKTCLARPVGIEAFLKAGVIPNSLMKVITKALGENPTAADTDLTELMSGLSDNPDMLQDVFAMADNVTIYCVVEPMVNPLPTDGTPRNDDLLYVDEIDLEDKLFILNFGVGGSRDLEAFRIATSGGVGSVPASTDVQLPPQQPVTD